ncbi:hypothetical protein ECZU29_21050 [Escherichia coli]|nr:hypothetical protein ECZU29_21050 [Escherichia coli]
MKNFRGLTTGGEVAAMTHLELVPVPPVAQLAGVSQHYGKTVALNNITRYSGPLHGRADWPDGVGKSSLLSLISGARVIEQGNVMVLAAICATRSIDATFARASPGCRRGWAKPLPHLVGV